MPVQKGTRARTEALTQCDCPQRLFVHEVAFSRMGKCRSTLPIWSASYFSVFVCQPPILGDESSILLAYGAGRVLLRIYRLRRLITKSAGLLTVCDEIGLVQRGRFGIPARTQTFLIFIMRLKSMQSTVFLQNNRWQMGVLQKQAG